ncbi:LRR-GTPase of the ROCO family, putative pseudogene [Ectocarpus siliculosus]|nr:LRR-GTPase of the ROCO family, putative pseudogene [Ectocarpus siliculosus]|eukprot:CBJ26194.1 LRR-GTPase of the ROCO family, putative pseudogene [Ectocarpus siliculosus]
MYSLFRSTGGDCWERRDNWDTAAELETWFRVEANNEGRVEKLCLNNNNLRGLIPPDLGNLAALRLLYLGGNQLNGSIPKELGALSELEDLSLCNNQLEGPIPKELGNLNAMAHLNPSYNILSGSIPPELGKLGVLRELWMSHNHLSGSIPEALGLLSNLGAILLSSNQLTGGPIPSQLLRLLDTLTGAQGGISRRAIINLDDSPWTEPPESIAAEGPQMIRDCFEDLYAEPCRVQRSSVKVILVGQEGAGKTSMKANEATPTGEWKEESTVFADVEGMELQGSFVRVYDCAGQLQMYLTPRAVCVLVCNAESFGQQRGRETGGHVTGDCRNMEELRVCPWLRSISRRVPDNDVILVATKCDLAGENTRDIGRRIGHACRTWLSSWVRDGMYPVRLERGVCLASCRPIRLNEHGERSAGNEVLQGGWACDWRDMEADSPSPSLIHRLVNKPDRGGLRGARMVLPRSWDIALSVLEALELGRDPVEIVVQKLADREGVTETARGKAVVYQGITVEDLNTKWHDTADELARRGITVTNAENALKGALSMRILKPLLNHKDEETFDGFVNLGDTGDARITLGDPSDIASWARFKNERVLEPRLARTMWPNGLSEYVFPTLASLGLTLPLESDPVGGLVVLLRLKKSRPERVRKVMHTFCLDHTPALSATQIYGEIGTPAPWVALSYVTSAARLMLLDFSGLRSRGYLKCPQHGDGMLLTNKATRAGGNLLEGSGCPQCSPDTKGLGAAAIELMRMIDIRLDLDVIAMEVKERFVDLVGRYSFPSQVESILRLKNLQAPAYMYPRLVRDMMLHFLCPVDMTIVPCGYGGEGYRLRKTRDWVEKLSPVLQVAMVTAKVALKAASGLEVDLSHFLKDMQDELVDELVDRILDEDALFRVLSGEEDIDANMQTETMTSYEALKTFMDQEQRERRKNARDGDGYVDFRKKMKRVSDGSGGMVWVRNENVQRWLDSHPNAAPLCEMRGHSGCSIMRN